MRRKKNEELNYLKMITVSAFVLIILSLSPFLIALSSANPIKAEMGIHPMRTSKVTISQQDFSTIPIIHPETSYTIVISESSNEYHPDEEKTFFVYLNLTDPGFYLLELEVNGTYVSVSGNVMGVIEATTPSGESFSISVPLLSDDFSAFTTFEMPMAKRIECVHVPSPGFANETSVGVELKVRSSSLHPGTIVITLSLNKILPSYGNHASLLLTASPLEERIEIIELNLSAMGVTEPGLYEVVFNASITFPYNTSANELTQKAYMLIELLSPGSIPFRKKIFDFWENNAEKTRTKTHSEIWYLDPTRESKYYIKTSVTVDALPFDVWGYFFMVDGSGNPMKFTPEGGALLGMINNRIEYQQILIPKKTQKVYLIIIADGPVRMRFQVFLAQDLVTSEITTELPRGVLIVTGFTFLHSITGVVIVIFTILHRRKIKKKGE